MVRKVVLSLGLAIAFGFAGSKAFADGQSEPVYKDAERDRVETLDRDARLSRRAPVRLHYRYRYRPASVTYKYRRHRAWDGRYGFYPRQHFFVDGVYTNGFYGPVTYAAVTYRTHVYYTPAYPVTFAYPPYAFVYGVTPAPIYNKPCLC